MRFWLFIGSLYLLAFSGMVVMFSGGTAGSACRDTGRAVHDIAAAAGNGGFLDGFWNWLADRGGSIEAACTP